MEEAYSAELQYMFGASILVAPLVAPLSESSTAELFLPPGGWMDMSTGSFLRGPQTATVPAPLNQV
jgi:alpha-glucosidase (family GH31 glycosyl hydrolase)